MLTGLYERHYNEILSFSMSLTKNLQAAEDITQEAFMRMLANSDTLLGLSQPQCRSWLYKTAKNIFIDRARKQRFEAETETEEKSTEDDLSSVMVAQLLYKLPQPEGALFRLRYFEGYNATELGEMFNLPPSTVRSKLSDARSILRRLLNQ